MSGGACSASQLVCLAASCTAPHSLGPPHPPLVCLTLGPKLTFLTLLSLTVRCSLSQLANGFVESPAEAFPEGRLVAGQVLSVEGDK